MYSDFGFYGGFTQLFPILFGVIFLIVAVMIVVTLIRGISQWNSNNHSPVLTVEAMVTSKRQEVSPAQQSEHDGYLYKFYVLLCNVSGRERRPHGAGRIGNGVWDAGGRRHGQADLSGNEVSQF